MLQEQVATTAFFVPVVLAWACVLGGLEGARRVLPTVWPAAEPARSSRRWLDLGVAVFVGVAIVGLGQLWHGGSLRWRWPGAWDHAAFVLAQLVIWAPLPLALLLRRQSAATAWTGARHLPTRLAVGFVLGSLAITVYLALRGELGRWPAIATEATTLRALAHAVPVYLEGVGLAFLFVRLQWALGRWLAAVVPALLFAVAHIPGALADADSAGTIVAFFAFNTAFVAVLLLVLARYRDVVALGVAHWLMDLAIDAF